MRELAPQSLLPPLCSSCLFMCVSSLPAPSVLCFEASIRFRCALISNGIDGALLESSFLRLPSIIASVFCLCAGPMGEDARRSIKQAAEKRTRLVRIGKGMSLLVPLSRSKCVRALAPEAALGLNKGLFQRPLKACYGMTALLLGGRGSFRVEFSGLGGIPLAWTMAQCHS